MRSLIFIFILLPIFILSQEDKDKQNFEISNLPTTEEVNLNTKKPLKASIYSAVIPGLGQIYNERYWKVPIVWGAIGTGIGFTLYYEDLRTKYRNAFIAELKGEDHEYAGILNDTRLGNLQDDMRRNRDYAIVITVLAYALNIIDATVDAHLYEIRKDSDLSVDPLAIANPLTGETHVGLSFKLVL